MLVFVDPIGSVERLPLTVVREILSRKCVQLDLIDTGAPISLADAEQMLQVSDSYLYL